MKRTIAECLKCKRFLALLSPEDVARTLDALLESTTLYYVDPSLPEHEELTAMSRANTGALIETRVKLHHLAAHLRGLCVFCAPTLATFAEPHEADLSASLEQAIKDGV